MTERHLVKRHPEHRQVVRNPMHIGIVVPRERDHRIAEIYGRLTEEEHFGRKVVLIYPHSKRDLPQTDHVLIPDRKTVFSDFARHTLRGHKVVGGSITQEHLEGLEAMVVIALAQDTISITGTLPHDLGNGLSGLRGRLTIIEIPETENAGPRPKKTEVPGYAHHVISTSQDVLDHLDDLSS